VKTKLFIFTIIIGIILPSVCKSQHLLNDSVTNKLKIGVEGFKNRYHSPSIVVVIVHDKEIIFSEAQGYIDLENKIPAAIDSKYPILSVTKMFTATMLMQLLQLNIVGIDDDIKKYVPEYTGDSYLAGKSGTTLLQLATHTSGLPRNSPADINFTKQVDKWLLTNVKYAAIEPATKKEFLQSLKFIKKEYSEFQLMSCGDRHYSNLGYSLLGIGLERAAKTDYSEYVTANICKPLKMLNTGFATESFNNTILAKGYYFNDSTKAFVKSPAFKANSALYAGGMYSTATDLAKFISFQFEHNSNDADKILSEKNRAMMQAFRIGWKPSFPYVLHEGAMLGYRCEIVCNPDIKIGWVVLTNTTDFEFSRINEYIGQLVLPVYNKKTVSDLYKYAGTYKLDGGYDSLKIYVKDDKLYSTYLQDTLFETPLISSENNRFKGQGKGSYSIGYEFILNNEAEIKMLNLGQLMWVKQ
jgi:CubicO group peptidase (beta-lactamase class C family)